VATEGHWARSTGEHPVASVAGRRRGHGAEAPRLPKKMRRLAIRTLLAQRVREEAVTVVEDLVLTAPRTKEVIGVLEAMGILRKCLLVTGGSQPELGRACRNLPRVKSLPADTINTLDLLNHDHLLLSVAAVRRIEELWAEEHPRLPARRSEAPVAAEASDDAPVATSEEIPAVEGEATEAQE
jgi:ribosomal protein L4